MVETAHLISTFEQLYSIHYSTTIYYTVQASVGRIHAESKQYVCMCGEYTYNSMAKFLFEVMKCRVLRVVSERLN